MENPGSPKKRIYTKSRLIKELAFRSGITQNQARAALEAIIEIAYREAKANFFILPGLCKFDVVRRKARNVRNPATGEMLVLPERDALRVALSKRAKETVVPRVAPMKPEEYAALAAVESAAVEQAEAVEVVAAAVAEAAAAGGAAAEPAPVVEAAPAPESAPAVGSAPVAESAPEVEPVPVVEQATPVEPISTVEQATVAEQPPAEPAPAEEPAPVAEAASAVEPAPAEEVVPVAEEPPVQKPVFTQAMEASVEPAPAQEQEPAAEEPVAQQPAEEPAPESPADQPAAEEPPADDGFVEAPEIKGDKAISFFCPTCGQEVIAPEETVGYEAECPTCGAIIIVPEQSAEGSTYASRGEAPKKEIISSNEVEDLNPQVLKNRTIRIDTMLFADQAAQEAQQAEEARRAAARKSSTMRIDLPDEF